MEELARVALVGTSRHPGGTADAEHPADVLVASLACDDRERAFLLQAGARAVYEQCGRTAEEAVAPAPAPAETRPFAPPQLVGLLENAMAAGSWDLFVEFLRQLEATGLLLPAELLPQALGASDPAVRERLLPVLGERGRWLSAFNPDWRWVTAGTGDLSARDRDALARRWDEGDIRERCRALETLRAGDAAYARQLLEGSIDKEKPEHRARLLGTLAVGLEADDEPLLDARLGDRAEQVRTVAAELLARIPGSALAQRMRARGEAILRAEPPGGKEKSLRIACHPPEEIDKEWTRDGVPAKPPQGRGKRAVWTEAVLGAVPPSAWCEHFSAEPAALIAAVAADQFAPAALAGWTRAAGVFAPIDPASAAWLRPLWEHWTADTARRGPAKKAEAHEFRQLLVQAMPSAEAERALLPLLERDISNEHADVLGLLAFVPRPWSDAFGRGYLAAVRKALKRPADNLAYQWAQSLFTAGRSLSLATFAAALEEWHTPEPGKNQWHSQSIAREIEGFTDTIRTRQRFYAEVAHP